MNAADNLEHVRMLQETSVTGAPLLSQALPAALHVATSVAVTALVTIAAPPLICNLRIKNTVLIDLHIIETVCKKEKKISNLGAGLVFFRNHFNSRTSITGLLPVHVNVLVEQPPVMPGMSVSMV